MIRLSYTLKLARTKLRAKRGVLITSIIVASLLFAALITTVVVFTGAEKSATEFIKKAGNDRYLVRTRPNIPYEKLSFLLTPSLEEIREIKAFEKQYYQELENKYKSLGLEYSKESEIPALQPAAWADPTLPEEQRVTVNHQSPVIQAMEAQKFEEYTKTATNKLSNLKQEGVKYGASGYYLVDKPSELSPIPDLRFIHDNREDFGDSSLKTGDSSTYGYYTNAIHNGFYSFTDQKILGRYLTTTDASNLKGIPVIVSAQEAASLFGKSVGIGAEPEVTSKKKVWLKDIQTKLNGQTYQVCYRNSTEQAMLDKIQRDYAEIKSNENVEGYKKPSLIYDYPKEPCGDIVIKEDSRTVAEKQVDAKSEETQKKLGIYIAPVHHLLTFQIVGIKYAQPYTDYAKGVDEYVKSLLVSQDDSSTLDIPIQMYELLPSKLKADSIQHQERSGTAVQQALASEEFAPRVLEFKSVENARAFLDNETCLASKSNCSKKFVASPYGSNYLILDEIGRLFNRITTIAFPSALGLAAIIIWFTVSRIMIDNRKETAVYRAMGAKRHDIAEIYTIYILIIASRIAIFSVVLGIGVALAIDYIYGQRLTDIAVNSFGVVSENARFSLIDFSSPLLWVIVCAIFITSILASLQPLIRNTLRPPIQDMREE